MSLPKFTASQGLMAYGSRRYVTRGVATDAARFLVAPGAGSAVGRGARETCATKVKNARCMNQDGTWRCQRGFPGETCYDVEAPWGHFGCNSHGGYPPCDKYGCGTGIPPHSTSETCRIECRNFAGICNWAEATAQCPMKYDLNGDPIGGACCTAREAEPVRGQACAAARQAIQKNSGCKNNCRSL